MTDWGWVSRQLDGIKADKRVNEATVDLLDAFSSIVDELSLNDDEQRTVLGYVQKLHLGHALVKDKSDEKWGPVIPGEYSVGNTVRVRADAYTGHHGILHNGKRGRITAVHQAKAVVLYDDAPSSEHSFYHEPAKLERLL